MVELQVCVSWCYSRSFTSSPHEIQVNSSHTELSQQSHSRYITYIPIFSCFTYTIVTPTSYMLMHIHRYTIFMHFMLCFSCGIFTRSPCVFIFPVWFSNNLFISNVSFVFMWSHIIYMLSQVYLSAHFSTYFPHMITYYSHNYMWNISDFFIWVNLCCASKNNLILTSSVQIAEMLKGAGTLLFQPKAS